MEKTISIFTIYIILKYISSNLHVYIGNRRFVNYMETGKPIENRKNRYTKIHPATSLNGILCVLRLHLCLYPNEDYEIKIFSLHLGLHIIMHLCKM